MYITGALCFLLSTVNHCLQTTISTQETVVIIV